MNLKRKILYLFKEYRELYNFNETKKDYICTLVKRNQSQERVINHLNHVEKNYKLYKRRELDDKCKTISKLCEEIEQHKKDYMNISERYQQLLDKYVNLQKRRIK